MIGKHTANDYIYILIFLHILVSARQVIAEILVITVDEGDILAK